jgi:hypothetical protein
MKIVRTEKVYLTANEINIIVAFETIVEEIIRRAQTKELFEVCDNVLGEIAELSHYIFPENQETSSL